MCPSVLNEHVPLSSSNGGKGSEGFLFVRDCSHLVLMVIFHLLLVYGDNFVIPPRNEIVDV